MSEEQPEQSRTELLYVALLQVQERLNLARLQWAEAERINDSLTISVLSVTASGGSDLTLRRKYLGYQRARKDADVALGAAERIFDMMREVAQTAAAEGLGFRTTQIHIYGDWERVMFVAAHLDETIEADQ